MSIEMHRTRRPAIAARWCPGSAWALLLCGLLIGLPLAGAAASAPDIEDPDVTRAIEAEFWADEIVDANAIDVVTSEGVVDLSGTVRSILVLERAEAIASSLVGVRAVVNRILVADSGRSDEEIAKSLQTALLHDPATDSYEIDVEVSAGMVTLEGAVDSWAEKRLAASVAKGVRGVREVRNEIDVALAADRADAEIVAEVERRLANDVRIDDFGIEVEAQDGVVTLSGVVGSLAEKRRAIADAWVAGSREVERDALEIRWWARDAMRRKSALELRPDDEIAAAVRDAFLYDPRVASFEPRVHVSSSVVTLSGVVDNLAAKRAAEEDARNVTGVWGVRNHLKVRPGSIPAADVLEERVERALADDEYVEGWEIDVDARAGRVRLYGTVDNSFEKEWAERRAERTNGVVEVLNNLAHEHTWSWKPDWEIRKQVESQLFWSPFVDAEEVKVRVKDGVVTLTGRVDTWAERADAERNAWEGNAKDVRNELTVAHEIYGPIAQVPTPRWGDWP